MYRTHANKPAIHKSHICREHRHTLSTVSRREPQTALNNLSTSCEACLRIEGSQFQQPVTHAVSYIFIYTAWRNVRPLSLPRIWIQIQLNSLYNTGPSTQTIEEVALTGVTWQLLVTTVYVRNTWTKHFFSPISLPKLGLGSTEILGTDWRSMSVSWPKPTRTSMCALVQCTCPGKASLWFSQENASVSVSVLYSYGCVHTQLSTTLWRWGVMIYFTPQGRCAAVWGWGKKLTTHVHIVVKLRMVQVYTYCCMCLHSINRDSFFSPCSAVWRCRLTPSTDIDRQISENVNSCNQNKGV